MEGAGFCCDIKAMNKVERERYEITVNRNDGPVWLTLRGAEGVKPFMRMEFGVR
jgi:hypothetical protein